VLGRHWEPQACWQSRPSQPAPAWSSAGSRRLLATLPQAPGGEEEPQAAPASAAERRLLRPPGAAAAATAAEGFARRVSQTLNQGSEVEIAPVAGGASLWHCLRALVVGARAPDFEASFMEPGGLREGGGEGGQELRIVARSGGAWEDFSWDTSCGFFVSNSTPALPLARKLAMELRKGQHATLHAYADAASAVATILRAVATVPRLEGGAPLTCTAGGLEQHGESVRVVVHARKMPELEAAPLPREEFLAWTPSAGADEETRRRFANSVRQRLETGWSVAMVCRGAESAQHATSALASVSGRTAEFEVWWADGLARPGSAVVPRELQLRAASGTSWSEFNTTDFSRTKLLRSSAESKVRTLAQLVGSRVKHDGAVALHAYADDSQAVSRALKALASVPVEHPGFCVRAVPSFGWASAGDHSGGRRRSLRLYVRRGRGPGAGKRKPSVDVR